MRETRPRGHGRLDEGAIGVMIEARGQQVGVFLGPEDGMMVADRIRRAVDIALEISEDEPETVTDREYRLPGLMRPGGDENG